MGLRWSGIEMEGMEMGRDGEGLRWRGKDRDGEGEGICCGVNS